jgi:hypothetical protein
MNPRQYPNKSSTSFTFDVSQKNAAEGLPRDAVTKKWDDRPSSEIRKTSSDLICCEVFGLEGIKGLESDGAHSCSR